MPSKKLKVIVTRKLPDPVETRMRELFDTELNHDDKPMTTEELVAAVVEENWVTFNRSAFLRGVTSWVLVAGLLGAAWYATR